MDVAGPSVEDRIAELAGVLNVANARLAEVMEEVLADEMWSGPGIHSPAQWLALKAGVSPERARDIVRVAQRRADFPVVIGAFDCGELALEQVAVLVKAPSWADADILQWGKVATVARLRKTIRKEWFVGDPDDAEVDDAEVDDADDAGPSPSRDDSDRVSTRMTDGHRWRIDGELDLGRGQIIEAALHEARTSLFERGQTTISTADCLVEVCERFVDGIDGPLRRDRAKTWIHLDVSDGSATTTDGWRLPVHVRDRLLCGGSIQPVWERDGVPFSVGRTQRVVPERTRRVVTRRDQGCRVPGCTNDRFVEIHHIIHWLEGGPTDTWNLVSLCPRHHRLHHQGRLGIAGNADDGLGVAFTDSIGRAIGPNGPPRPPGGELPRPEAPYRPPLGGRVDYAWVGLGWVHPKELHRRADAARARSEPRHPRPDTS